MFILKTQKSNKKKIIKFYQNLINLKCFLHYSFRGEKIKKNEINFVGKQKQTVHVRQEQLLVNVMPKKELYLH